MSALLWEFIALLYAPLGAYGALVEGTRCIAVRHEREEPALFA